MPFLMFFLFLIIGAVSAALKGDTSGIEFILKAVIYIGAFFLFGLMLSACP